MLAICCCNLSMELFFFFNFADLLWREKDMYRSWNKRISGA
jgi:hypothetical protein